MPVTPPRSRRKSHDLALRAALKLTLPAALLGCPAAPETPAVTVHPAEPGPAPTVVTTSHPAAVDPRAKGCGATGKASDGEDVASCCAALIGVGAEPIATGEVARRCCDTLIARNDERMKKGGDQEMPQRDACCSQAQWQGSMTCTPWGPPVPPAMSAERRRRGRRRSVDLRARVRAQRPRVPEIPGLARAARATWLGRMVNEHESARVFEGLADAMRRAGWDAADVGVCQGFAGEEREHGVLCGAVVEALGGEAIATAPGPLAIPDHADVSPVEGVLRDLLSVCCLSETVAVALIGAERLDMPEGELRDLLTRIYADEVGHARFGWRIIAAMASALDSPSRARLGDYLAIAFADLERHELAHLPLDATPPPEGAAVGLCSGPDARELFYATVEEVIVPGLEAVGLDAGRAWAERARA